MYGSFYCIVAVASAIRILSEKTLSYMVGLDTCVPVPLCVDDTDESFLARATRVQVALIELADQLTDINAQLRLEFSVSGLLAVSPPITEHTCSKRERLALKASLVELAGMGSPPDGLADNESAIR